MVERHSTLGGVCLNVGCIPSKALLHVAKDIEEAKHIEKAGILYEEPKNEIKKDAEYKRGVVKKLTGGL
ncbi:dihydrolipoyl dehydrogenase, partial [Aliarcobacter butzleri]